MSAGEFNLRRYEGAISGPISDNVKARVSVLSHDRGGDVTNTYLNVRHGEQDWWGVRGIVDWQLSDHLDARVKAQYFEGDMDVLFFNSAPIDRFLPGTQEWLIAAGADSDLPRRSGFHEYQSPLLDPYDKFDMSMVELNLKYDFGPAGLTAVLGHVEGKNDMLNSFLNLPAQAGVQGMQNTLDQWTAELRLTSQLDHPLEWIVGTFYQRNDDSQFKGFFLDYSAALRDMDGDGLTRYNADSPDDLLDGVLPIFPGSNVVLTGANAGTSEELDTYAAFVHTKYVWNERLTTTHAARYTREKKTSDVAFIGTVEIPVSLGVTPGTVGQLNDVLAFTRLSDAQQRQVALTIFEDYHALDANGEVIRFPMRDVWEEVTWRLAADYQITNTALVYTSVSTGFKGGAFSRDPNLGGVAITADPEESLVYEIGGKSQWWNRRLQLNASVFYNEHRDFQSSQFVIDTSGTSVSLLTNLPELEIYGGELELQVMPADGLFIAANVGALKTEVTEVLPGNESLLGKELPNAADLNFSGLVRYDLVTTLGTLSPQASWRYRGETWSSKDNNDTTGKLGNFWTADARIGYSSPNGDLYGSLYVRNVFDEVQPIFNVLADASAIGSSASKLNERRNWGVMFGYRF